MSKSHWLKDEDQKGNFSNDKQDTFDPKKRYIGIRLQQGVPLLDRDWNELEDLRRHAEVTLRRCYIGNGTPDDGFRISLIDPETLDFRISAGRCLVDGFDVVNEPYDEGGNKLDFLLYSQQEGVPPLTTGTQGRLDTVYLDVWVEEVAKDRDSALGNSQDIDMETCRRHKLEWRVRVDEGSQGYEKQPFHHYYDIAKLSWISSGRLTHYYEVEDLRVTGLTVFQLRADVESLKDHAEKHTHSQLVKPGSQWPPMPVLLVDTTGNVGIGTSNPRNNIHIQGASSAPIKNDMHDRPGLAISGNYPQLDLFSAVNNPTHGPTIRMGGYNDDSQTTFKHWSIGTSARNSSFLDFGVGPNSDPNPHAGIRNHNGKTVMTLLETGNVGIGTTTPLSVVGNGTLKNSLETTGWILARGNGENTWGDPSSRIGVMKAGGSDCDGWWISANPNNTFAIHQACVGDRITIDSNGNVGIGTPDPGAKLEVSGNIMGQSFRNAPDSFFVGGDGDKFYAVAFRDDDWGNGPAEFEITRSDVHLDREWWGSMNLNINWHANNWGHGASFIERRYYYKSRTFVKDVVEYPYNPYLLVWLRGNTTYYYRSLNNRVVLYQILGTNNQQCSFDPVGYTGYSTAVDCTYRPEGCIPPGTTISGDFYISGKSHASSRSGPGIDYSEYFESKNGTEIEPGTSVVLDDGKIRPTKKGETPFGVISANPIIAGGVPIEWPKKYLRDEFGNQIMEEYQEEIMAPKKEKVKKERQKMEKKKVKEKVTRREIVKIKGKYCQKEVTETIEREIEEPVFKEVNLYDAKGKEVIGKHRIPVMETYEEEIDILDEMGQPVMIGTGKFETKTRTKINPEYDEKKEYISREKRPEWNCVGLLGQLPLRKGQPVADTWIKIKDISKDVELWLVK